MQPYKEIDDHYKIPDPWKIKSNPEDLKRREYILEVLRFIAKRVTFNRSLDIGCGEGFITQYIPAVEIYGYEVSDNAAQRLPPNVKRVKSPEGKYDLITMFGIFYPHYRVDLFLDLVQKHASKYVVTSNILTWEDPKINLVPGKQIFTAEFPYEPGEKFIQKLRVFEL